MKLSHTKLIVISGLIWFAIGFYLLQLGLGLLMTGSNLESVATGNYPLLRFLSPLLSIESAILSLIVLALLIGYFKGRYVLGKSARQGVARIQTFPNPTHLSNIYSAKYYILLGAMVGLGISIKYFGLSNDIRGFIDTAIGAALVNGAMIYFRLAQDLKTKASKDKTTEQLQD